MNLKQLKYFCEVVDTGNARIAAEKLFVAPTAISMQISNLEELLGAPLFDRATRPMALTQLGQFVYPKAKELLFASKRLESEAKDMASGNLGWLGIGFTRSSIFSILPEAVRAMQAAFPNVRIDLLEILTEEQPVSLRTGIIHIGIARTLGAFTREPDLNYTELFDDPLVAALPIEHPLAKKHTIKAKDLESLPFICYPKAASSYFSRQVIAVLESAGAVMRISYEAKEIHTALGLVAAGLGATVVGQSVSKNNRADIRFVTIENVHTRSKVFAVRKANTSNPSVDVFFDKLYQQVPN
jgi:DNA-binding transcriptional LysR family regulator